MFGIKKDKKRKQSQIETFDKNKALIQSVPVLDYALPEEVVLALSVKYFNDPTPCEIHRGAVLKRVMMELIEICPNGEIMSVDKLGEHSRDFADDVAFIRLT